MLLMSKTDNLQFQGPNRIKRYKGPIYDSTNFGSQTKKSIFYLHNLQKLTNYLKPTKGSLCKVALGFPYAY